MIATFSARRDRATERTRRSVSLPINRCVATADAWRGGRRGDRRRRRSTSINAFSAGVPAFRPAFPVPILAALVRRATRRRDQITHRRYETLQRRPERDAPVWPARLSPPLLPPRLSIRSRFRSASEIREGRRVTSSRRRRRRPAVTFVKRDDALQLQLGARRVCPESPPPPFGSSSRRRVPATCSSGPAGIVGFVGTTR